MPFRQAASRYFVSLCEYHMRISCATESAVTENTGNNHVTLFDERVLAGSKSESNAHCNSVIRHNVLASPSLYRHLFILAGTEATHVVILAPSLVESSKQSILLSALFLALSDCHTQPHQVAAKQHLQALSIPCKTLKSL